MDSRKALASRASFSLQGLLVVRSGLRLLRQIAAVKDDLATFFL